MTDFVEKDCQETPLFDPRILLRLDPSKFKAGYKNGVSPLHPGEHLHIRPLSIGDYEKGYLDLLKQLTAVGDVSKEDFIGRFSQMKSCEDTYFIVVIEDLKSGQIIGSATLVKEQKFIHHVSSRGRVEDVIVSDLYRGQQLGKILLDVLVALSQDLGCYKVSLECKDKNVEFYTQFGFQKTEGQNFMQLRFFD
ncbi:unnamed protein product [Candidula unifasciata]|uniref:Glucosamine 6-phosphate N-acetyltransferase n=1 Tax=Candidula unifasciata TaxID=100452 RepID=A0A8S3ZZS3_9EUPU|nr:unnamed protein product [Candidula unifasciata]